MRTAIYSIESLLSFFKLNIIATMTQLKAVLGTTVDMTVYRKLRKISYLTSYSHHGKYYTLNEFTRFDSLGLWRHGDARFSKYGTLINTAQALVSLAEKGYTLSELRRIVGCEVKETVLTLVRQNRIHREIIDGQFVYFTPTLATQQKQHRLRMNANARPGAQEPDVLAHEVRAAIILFVSLLDEKQRRLYAGLESLRIGRGGDAEIARLLDLDTHTVAKGRHQLLNRDLEIERVRRKGALDAPALKKTPQLIEGLQNIMKYETAGDPKTGLKWTRKATRKVARELQQEGIMVSAKSVARILKKMGYSLRCNRKKLALSGNGSTHERKQRDLQFRHICSTRERFVRQGTPVIGVDTKKKELIGNFKNPGRVWRDRDRPVADHDFPSYAKAKISPYGIYDTTENTGMVCVGISHDTPAFAADSIIDWWERVGAQQYPNAKDILILADNGGSNRPTSVALKYHLWKSLCLQYGLAVTVCHYPTGASKWNPIEHRLFSEISKNWAGEPLVSIQTALNFIRTTQTSSGLHVSAMLNRKHYQCKEKIPKEQAAKMIVQRNSTFPNLNYRLLHPK